MSMFKEKKAKFEINLSGTKVSFDVLEDFSRRFDVPESFSSTFNIFDPDNYASGRYLFQIYKSYWDYISGIFIKDIDGTVVMKIAVEKLADTNLSINSIKQFQEILSKNFIATYDKEERKKNKIVDPHSFAVTTFLSGEWLNYCFEISQMDEIAYSIPFSDAHYLTVKFELIVNYNEERFIKKANKHIQEIMHSFKITPP
jgi:hypothetical protein